MLTTLLLFGPVLCRFPALPCVMLPVAVLSRNRFFAPDLLLCDISLAAAAARGSRRRSRSVARAGPAAALLAPSPPRAAAAFPAAAAARLQLLVHRPGHIL